MSAAPANSAMQPEFNFRLAVGLFGILLAAMMSGLNSRIPSLLLVDLRGILGIGIDQGAWLDGLYSAGELVAMPFASWFAITYSLRRFHLTMLCSAMLLGLLLPFVESLHGLMLLRTLQGICSGALIPTLMMAALRFLPAPIRLHGLALYAMTATLSPNVALWIASHFTSGGGDWRWVYWEVLPIGGLAAVCVAWGIPKLPLALPRLKQANWTGMAMGIPGLMLLALGISQGVRLDWLHSPMIQSCLFAGGLLTLGFLLSEWFHPAPFMKLQLLGRRNLGVGFTVFLLMLVAMTAAVGVPLMTLEHVQGLRLEQLTSLGLIVALPQFVLGSLVAMLLYRKWVDARYLLAIGLLLMAAACFMASNIDSQWNVEQFYFIQAMQALGQPLAIVPMLFLGTGVVAPMEGPFVSGLINTLRCLGTISGGALIAGLMQDRGAWHRQYLADSLAQMPNAGELTQVLAQQVTVLASADIFRVFGAVFVLLVPLAVALKRIPAPVINLPGNVEKA